MEILKKFLIFQETETLKNFLYFTLKKFLTFLETELSSPKEVNTLDKTHLGEIKCLSSLYYLLICETFSFLIQPSFLNTVKSG